MLVLLAATALGGGLESTGFDGLRWGESIPAGRGDIDTSNPFEPAWFQPPESYPKLWNAPVAGVVFTEVPLFGGLGCVHVELVAGRPNTDAAVAALSSVYGKPFAPFDGILAWTTSRANIQVRTDVAGSSSVSACGLDQLRQHRAQVDVDDAHLFLMTVADWRAMVGQGVAPEFELTAEEEAKYPELQAVYMASLRGVSSPNLVASSLEAMLSNQARYAQAALPPPASTPSPETATALRACQDRLNAGFRTKKRMDEYRACLRAAAGHEPAP